jgi:chromosome segregation ATPase
VLAEIKVSDKYIEAKKQVELARSKDPTLAARLGALKAEQERLASRLKDIGGTLSDSDAIVGSLYSDLQKARGTDDEDRIKSARNKAVVDNETLQRKFDEVRRQLNDCGNQIAKTERLIVDNQTDERSAIANVVQLKKDRQKAAKLVRTVAQAVGKDP